MRPLESVLSVILLAKLAMALNLTTALPASQHCYSLIISVMIIVQQAILKTKLSRSVFSVINLVMVVLI